MHLGYCRRFTVGVKQTEVNLVRGSPLSDFDDWWGEAIGTVVSVAGNLSIMAPCQA